FYEEKKKSIQRSKWIKKWVSEKNQRNHMSLLKELRENDPNDFRSYLRMDETSFRHLLNMLEVHLKKQDTIMRESISPEERLVVTLRILATGRSYEDLNFSTCIAAQTLGYIIPETCKVIFDVLKDQYMKICVSPAKINYIVLSICVLHNYLRKVSSTYITSSTIDKEDSKTGITVEGEWRKEISNNLTPLRAVQTTNIPLTAKLNREAYLKYFKGNGRVEWQNEMVQHRKV
ncbi:hypothetical protein NQ314_019465, partial [Rhamnusium bicolor]